MKISTIGSLGISFPLSSRGPNPQSIRGLISPISISPTYSPISNNHQSPNKRVFRASASFNGRIINSNGGGNCAREEQSDITSRRIINSNGGGNCAREEQSDITSRREKDHYTLLGVPCDASYSDIRVAYRRLALKYHPDVMHLHQRETATECFSEINEAYDTLSDPQKRKAYDDLHLIPSFDTAVTAASSSSFGHWRGRNWETDQCWC